MISILMKLTTAQLVALIPATLVLYWTSWMIYTLIFHPLAKIPGPFLARISRMWVIYRLYVGDMERVQRSFHAKHGSLVRIAPNEIACADPEAIKIVYPVHSPLSKTDFYPVWRSDMFSKYPDHFSSTDEKQHAERRRLVNNVWSLSNVLQSEPYIDKCTELFIQRIGEYADRKEVFDLGTWLQW
jgi:hypothetical protein